MGKKEKYQDLAEHVVDLLGGKDNISFFTHCITRLRFNLKDQGLAKTAEIKRLANVVGVQHSGEQLQIIIGQEVGEAYKLICEKSGLKAQAAIDENLDEVQEKKDLSIKGIGNAILSSLSGCLTPIIPILIVSAMFKTLTAVFGPNMLNVMPETSNLYVLFNFSGDAAFYFLPVAVGYTAAKRFGVNPVLGILMGGILIHPALSKIAEAGEAFTVFGIPCLAQNYTSSIFPAILSVWVMSYIERFFNKHTPSVLKPVFAPFLTILVTLPVSLCVLGPAGHFLGEYISKFFLWMGNSGGIFKVLAIAIVAALWQYLVMTGMHWLLITTTMVVMAETGQESFVLATSCSAFTVGGMCLGAFLRQKEGDKKSLSLSYIVAQLIGGITEPGLYGVGLRYRRPLLGMMAGGFAGGLYAGITNLTAYQIVPVGNFLSLLDFVGGHNMNFINGIIAAVIAFSVAAIVTFLLGFDEKKLAE
ncbi:MAG: PTS transporter subunit EIIC [Lachnospiraceae bacterium]|jgi:PTS system beta-glucosides-specific IIC component|nr:PTS transporter subunit EIIC [Lachnospiraceae bacterium]